MSLIVRDQAAYSQATNATTAVPVTTNQGSITTQSFSTATTASTSFNVTSTPTSLITATSNIMLQMVSYSGTPLTNGIPILTVSAQSAGSFTIKVSNYGAN